MNPKFQSKSVFSDVKLACEEAEIDEQWSFVGSKSNQRWIWYAVEHSTNIILAYVFGKRKDIVFKELKALLAPLNIKHFYTDDWGPMNDILNPISTKWENVILKRLSVRI